MPVVINVCQQLTLEVMFLSTLILRTLHVYNVYNLSNLNKKIDQV